MCWLDGIINIIQMYKFRPQVFLVSAKMLDKHWKRLLMEALSWTVKSHLNVDLDVLHADAHELGVDLEDAIAGRDELELGKGGWNFRLRSLKTNQTNNLKWWFEPGWKTPRCSKLTKAWQGIEREASIPNQRQLELSLTIFFKAGLDHHFSPTYKKMDAAYNYLEN